MGKIRALDPMVDWNIKLMNVPMAWQYTEGEGVVVGVIDTGVDITHREFGWEGGEEITGEDSLATIRSKYARSMMAVNLGTHPTILPGWNFVDNNDEIFDLYFLRHGTYLAGTIAAVDNGFGTTGIAPKAKVRPYVVLDKSKRTTPEMVAQAVFKAIEDKCDIINISLVLWRAIELDNALQYAYEKDVIVVLPTGNDNKNTIRYPASTMNGVIVGGCNAVGDRWVHNSYTGSNYGDGMLCMTPADAQVVLDTWRSRFTKAEGTSQSAANMSGIVALMYGLLPQANWIDVDKPVLETVKTYIAQNCSQAVYTVEEGYGVPDVGKLIKTLYNKYSQSPEAKARAEIRASMARVYGELAIMERALDKLGGL